MSGWIRMGGGLISRIQLERHVSMTMSNVLPISATYGDMSLKGRGGARLRRSPPHGNTRSRGTVSFLLHVTLGFAL